MVDQAAPHGALHARDDRSVASRLAAVAAIVTLTVLLAMPAQGAFTLVGNNQFYTSQDGQTWQPSVNDDWSMWFRSLTYGGGQWLAGTEWMGGLIYTSPNGLDWTAQTTGAGWPGTITGIAYGTPGGAPAYVAVGPTVQSC